MIEERDLDFPWPDCAYCEDGGTMNYEPGTWWCDDCGANWRSNGHFAGWDFGTLSL